MSDMHTDPVDPDERAADLIDWAINEFDGWMADDHYDARVPLDRIIERFRQYREEAADALASQNTDPAR
jgi:hypothetical protein